MPARVIAHGGVAGRHVRALRRLDDEAHAGGSLVSSAPSRRDRQAHDERAQGVRRMRVTSRRMRRGGRNEKRERSHTS
ncbi:MAG: hypothetical protein ACYCX6_12405 [Vulcanimicrobiaceae bacterium]